MISILYKNKYYMIDKEDKYRSIHYHIVELYKNEISKNINFIENFYYLYLIQSKKYILTNDQYDVVDIHKSFNNIYYYLDFPLEMKNMIDLCIPFIKIIILSLFLIIRIDSILISMNIQCKAFEDYYCILLYLCISFILCTMFYYSYYFMYHMISYICRELDRDIGDLMNMYGSIIMPYCY
jgi:hypothetical protein